MRSTTASSFVELPLTIMMIVPIALLAINIGFIGIGSFYNDAACREAARVAGTTSSEDTALLAARAAVKSFAVAGGKISSPEVVSVKFDVHTDSDGNRIDISSLTPQDPDNPGSANSDLNNAPTVNVSTKLVLALPAPMLFCGDKFTDSVTLSSQYAFPIIHAADNPDDDSNDELDAETETADGPDETSDVETIEE